MYVLYNVNVIMLIHQCIIILCKQDHVMDIKMYIRNQVFHGHPTLLLERFGNGALSMTSRSLYKERFLLQFPQTGCRASDP